MKKSDRMKQVIFPERIKEPLKAEDTLLFIDSLKDIDYVAVSPTLTVFYSDFNHFSVETVLVVPSEKDKEIVRERAKQFNKPMLLWIDVVENKDVYKNRKKFTLENYVYEAPQLEDAILLYLDYLKKLWLLDPRDVYYMMKSVDEKKRKHVIENSKERETYSLLKKIMSWDEKKRTILDLSD